MDLGLLKRRLNSSAYDDRRVTKDAAIAGSDFTQKAMETSTKIEAGEKVLLMEEAVNRSRRSEGIEEVTAKDAQNTELEELSSCVNTTKKSEKNDDQRESKHHRRKEER